MKKVTVTITDKAGSLKANKYKTGQVVELRETVAKQFVAGGFAEMGGTLPKKKIDKDVTFEENKEYSVILLKAYQGLKKGDATQILGKDLQALIDKKIVELVPDETV